MDKTPDVFGNSIRRVRIARGMTLHEVAHAAGTTPTQVARLEKGIRRLNLMWEQRLSKALKVSIEELYGGIKDYNRQSVLLPTDNNIVEKLEEGSKKEFISRAFMNICFRISAAWAGWHSDLRIRDPLAIYEQSLFLHDIFVELFNKIGETEELTAAMKQYLSYSEQKLIGAPALERGRGGALIPKPE